MPDFGELVGSIDVYVFLPGLILAFILLVIPGISDVIVWMAKFVRHFLRDIFDFFLNFFLGKKN